MAEAELFKHVNVTTPDMVGRNRMAAAIKVTASVFWIRDVDVSISRTSANNISDNHSFLNVLNVENVENLIRSDERLVETKGNCDFNKESLANSYFLLQMHHAKSLKMRY